MGTILQSLENDSRITARWGPAAYAAAEALTWGSRSIMFGVGTSVVCAALLQVPAGEAARIGLGVGGLALALPVGATVAGDGAGLLFAAFRAITQRDDDGDERDDERPAPRTAPASVRVEQWAFDGEAPNGVPNVKHAERYELPCSPRQLTDFARMALDGRNISEASVKQHAHIGRSAWLGLRSELLNRGHITWRHDRASTQGVTLTRGGAALCRAVLRDPPTGGGASW
jgi:hypothetical protein